MADITLEEEFSRLREGSWNIAFTDFSLDYNRDSTNLYCFFEGKDDSKYYGIRITENTGKDFETYVCNGKDNVIKLFDVIASNTAYNQNKILFFVDKDYSSIVNPEGIYTTPTYSFENLYTNSSCIERIIIQELGLKRTEEDYSVIQNMYINLFEKFHQKVTLINHWLACQNDLRESGHTLRLNIDEALKEYFKGIVLPDLTDIKNLSDLNDQNIIEENLFPTATKIDVDVLNEKENYFNGNFGELYRGKFEIKFLVSFFDRIKSEIGKKLANQIHFKKKSSCNITFQDSNILSTLSQYAFTPICLKNYLKKY